MSVLSAYEEKDYRLVLQTCQTIADNVIEEKVENEQWRINLEFIGSLTSIDIRDKLKEQAFLAVFALEEVTKGLRK